MLVASIALASGMVSAMPADQLPDGTLRTVIEQYQADKGSLERIWTISVSLHRRKKLGDLNRATLARLDALDFDKLPFDAQLDWLLLRREIQHRDEELGREAGQYEEIARFMPFAERIVALEESRRRFERVQPRHAAEALEQIRKEISALRAQPKPEGEQPKRSVVWRAASKVDELRATLKDWKAFSAGYDPTFSWWAEEPYKAVESALEAYSAFLREEVAGVPKGDTSAIIGDPIGRAALIEQLKSEYIPYTPEELVKIAEKEFAWCDAEMAKATAELGFKDWHDALERVKGLHVEPGDQPAMIRDLALEAIQFLEERGLVTIPPLAKETWRMEMMSPERQKVSPFFLGGETILVSYPTDAMSHKEKLMSMRANNRHFSRATVQHELIPGHHLQGFMTDRHSTQRQMFYTPFWIEGWALYWEMRLWDLGFPKTPEDRIGMLFWRMHRCARIIFSLSFHLGRWSPQECIDYLVDRVGHERSTAEAEVRRSFSGQYGPLYQLAYMIGGLQFRAMHEEFVKSGKMTEREFHDGILKGGNIPPAMVRTHLARPKLNRKYDATYRFYPAID